MNRAEMNVATGELKIIAFTGAELDAWTAKKAAWDAGADARKASEVRADRNARLVATDWTQIADSTADKAAWRAYRQALRDVPSQAGFPQSVTWPQEP